MASDLFLDEVHDILQTVFAWDDSHLHKFGTGGKRFNDPATRYFLAPLVDGEDDPGVPEWRVRLDEVLSRKGDKLHYMYDFGDSWDHTLTLQGISDLSDDAPRAVCTAGRRPAPVDGCGGVPGYELWNAVNDPGHPLHTEALTDFREMCGREEDYDPGAWAPVPFDQDKVNKLLTERFDHTGASRDERNSWEAVPAPKQLDPVEELLWWSRGGPDHGPINELVERARLDRDIEPAPETVEAAVVPYTWLLDHLAGDGVQLTQVGHLPPTSVEEASQILSLNETWVGKLDREEQTCPVQLLRRSAQAMRLVRRYRGRLVLTPAGRRLRSDPASVWAHVVERLPFGAESSLEEFAEILFLLSMAAGEPEPERRTAQILEIAGVDGPNGVQVSDVLLLVSNTHGLLRLMGAWPGRWGQGEVAPAGTTIARAALRRWPWIG